MSYKILGFFGEYRFLSNFWPSLIEFEGLNYPTVENAYQAAKTTEEKERMRFVNVSAAAAKSLGQKVKLRPDWESFKIPVMNQCLKAKFALPDLKKLLLSTGDAYLEETNTWKDRYWGVCDGEGQNWLGRLIMSIRDDIVLQEKLAALEHVQWSHWTRYMLNNLTSENIERWTRQTITKYEDLSEKEKDSDREWAKKVMFIVEESNNEKR